MKTAQKKFGFIVFLTAVVILGVFAFRGLQTLSNNKKQKEHSISGIVELWNDKNYDELTIKAADYLQKHPDDSHIRILRGMALLNIAELGVQAAYQKDTQAIWGAVHEIRRALTINPSVSYKDEANYVLGKAYYLLGGVQLKKAISYLESALERKITTPEAHEFLLAAYKDQGEYDKAITLIANLIHKEASGGKTGQSINGLRLTLIDMYLDTNDLAGARTQIAISISNSAENSTQYNALLIRQARLMLAEGRTQKAITILITLVEKDPQSFEALYYLGIAYDTMKESGKARYYWRQSLAVNPYWDKVLEKLSDSAAD